MVDIGGGTTDFTLIAVTESERANWRWSAWPWANTSCWAATISTWRWRARWPQRLAEKGTRIDSRQMQALWNNCRVAKEKLLEPDSKAKEQAGDHSRARAPAWWAAPSKPRCCAAISSRCWAKASCPRWPAPRCRRRQRRVGLQELGLPYAADPAITRHMARFLRQQAAGVEQGAVRRGPSGLACPTHVLFNGGVLNAALVRERILATLDSWLAEEGFRAVQPLSGEDLMHAVARGAAYYGLARSGRGVRIRGGVPRTYYVGIESAMPSVPGFPAPLKALTVVPFGMEEGTDIAHPRPRIRPGGRPAGRVPLLHLDRAQERHSPAT